MVATLFEWKGSAELLKINKSNISPFFSVPKEVNFESWMLISWEIVFVFKLLLDSIFVQLLQINTVADLILLSTLFSTRKSY